MRPIVVSLLYALSFQCVATDTLDCLGDPYTVMIHVGYEENDEDFLAGLMLYQRGYSDPIETYSKKDLHIQIFRWVGDGFGNLIEMSSGSKDKMPFALAASDERGIVKVNGMKFDIKCNWQR